MFELSINMDQELLLEVDRDQFLTPRFLEEMGNALIYHIIQAAKEDLKRQGNQKTPRGKPEGIPDDPKFFESFGFDVKRDKTIEIYSTWPWIEQIVEGRNPYPMKWATKPKVSKVPFNKKTPIIKTAPDGRDPWIHPGFKKHSFIERGMEKAFQKMEVNLANQLLRVWGK